MWTPRLLETEEQRAERERSWRHERRENSIKEHRRARCDVQVQSATFIAMDIIETSGIDDKMRFVGPSSPSFWHMHSTLSKRRQCESSFSRLHRCIGGRLERNLIYWIEHYRAWCCADPHDRIYALLSLCEKPDGVAKITPRYDSDLTELLLETLPYKNARYNSAQSWTECTVLLLDALSIVPESACMEPLIRIRCSSTMNRRQGRGNHTGQPLRLQDTIFDAYKLETKDFHLEICDIDLTTYMKERTAHVAVPAGTYKTAVTTLFGAKALPQKVFMNGRFAFVVCAGAAAGDYLIQLDVQGYYFVARSDGNRYKIIGHALAIEIQDGLHVYKNIDRRPQIKAVFDARDLLVLVCLQKYAVTPEHVWRLLAMPVCHYPESSYLLGAKVGHYSDLTQLVH